MLPEADAKGLHAMLQGDRVQNLVK